MNEQLPSSGPEPVDISIEEPTPAPELSEEEQATERLERRITRLLEPEHAEQFALLVRSLPASEALKTYRAFFTAANERQSLILVRVSLKKLTQQAIVSHLPQITSIRPDIATEMAQCWFDLYSDVVEAMLQGQPLPEDVSTDVLTAAQFVLAEELPEGEEASALTTALQRAAQLQADCAMWQQKSAAAQSEVAHLTREMEHLKNKLQRAEERVETVTAQERELATRRSERERRRAQQTLEASERELERQQLQHAQEVATLQRVTEQLEQKVRSAESERSQQLSSLLSKERAESERLRTRHAQQLTELQSKISSLQQELTAYAEQEDEAFDAALLDDALVISYTSIDPDPIQRLTDLFELYAAFLAEQREHRGLVRHSNISQFKGRKPSGILLLGLEQLLLDGVNIPLTRYLKMSVLRQETVLHQLIGRTESPRLQGHS